MEPETLRCGAMRGGQGAGLWRDRAMMRAELWVRGGGGGHGSDHGAWRDGGHAWYHAWYMRPHGAIKTTHTLPPPYAPMARAGTRPRWQSCRGGGRPESRPLGLLRVFGMV